MDDAIEVDDQPGYNIRVWGNTIRHCFSGISSQGWFRGDYWNAGPIYVFRNVIQGGRDPFGRSDVTGEVYYTNYAFKVGADNEWPGRIHYYHNTISIPDSPLNGNGIQDAGGRYFSGIVSRNNLWNVSWRVFSLRYSTTIVDHDMDCDNLHNVGTPTDSKFVAWSRDGGPDGDGVYRNLTNFQVYTGQEMRGISDNGTLFDADLSLQSGSPEIDAGCVIVGFNDRGPWAYQGAKPDIGAFEHVNAPDLTTSQKIASPGGASTGEHVAYEVRIVNTGAPLTSTVVMTDVIPLGLEYVSGSLDATSGTTRTSQGTNTIIHWQGDMDQVSLVEITYEARIVVGHTAVLTNVALIDSGVGSAIPRSAIVIANGQSSYLPVIPNSYR
jgi:uncharacterized repeat protein (TIGR01451 family)